MKLPIFKKHNVKTLEFLKFWSGQYNYDNEYLYDDNINKKLTEERIWELFLWKNGRPLSEKKKISIQENYIKEKSEVPKKNDSMLLEDYLNRPGGAIWRIFWLHCNYPNEFPIYDQHVHRAMASIRCWADIEIPFYNKKKVRCYVNDYLPFWKLFESYDSKMVDEALWAYGRFLKAGYVFD